MSSIRFGRWSHRRTLRYKPIDVVARPGMVQVPTDIGDVFVFQSGATVTLRDRRAVVSSVHGESPGYIALCAARAVGHGFEWRGGFHPSAGEVTDEEAIESTP